MDTTAPQAPERRTSGACFLRQMWLSRHSFQTQALQPAPAETQCCYKLLRYESQQVRGAAIAQHRSSGRSAQLSSQ